jgi:hypothetical protein
VAKLDWAKNEQLRRLKRFGGEPIGQIDVSPSPKAPLRGNSPKAPLQSKKRQKIERRRAASTATLPKVLINPADVNAPDAFERFRLEVAHLNREIAGLEKQVQQLRGRRSAVLAVLKKIAPPGKPYHVAKLIPADEAANRKMRRRKKATVRTATKRGPKIP